ncbi:GAF domain-containing sensor histidine kinase [Labilibacter marinus]|uniref:GAF domain-containing sensor histidine kinase n=1 Tax=Labilibacter marinus TaxID=1477105 RepID=UPI00082BC5BB|nr:GAF domain-containing sensor histidine kinase [Labilibacter marinus]
MKKFSTVTIRQTQESKKVSISSNSKPEIIDSTISKWQTLIDTLAKIVNVPSSLIMKLNRDSIEVFLKSNTTENPYELHEKADLIYGLYCESVIGTQDQLIVPDATKSEVWSKNNPDVDINMISYLGVPINWPDGECFGTVCVLDSKENFYSQDFIDLINQIKQHIELDLQLLLSNAELKELNEVKTKFMSLISHDVRGNIGTLNQFLQFIAKDFDNYDTSELKKTLVTLSQISSTSFNTLDNLLKWSKSDLVNLKPNIQPVNINKIVKELLSFFNYALRLKSIRVNTSFYSEHTIIKTDKNMINAIIRNIISNGIKYNTKGGELNIKVVLVDNKHEITIQDTGIGMSKKDLDKLFKYNTQHSLETSDEISTGIGLLLTKEFIDKIGATINVKSKIDIGTYFIITI